MDGTATRRTPLGLGMVIWNLRESLVVFLVGHGVLRG